MSSVSLASAPTGTVSVAPAQTGSVSIAPAPTGTVTIDPNNYSKTGTVTIYDPNAGYSTGTTGSTTTEQTDPYSYWGGSANYNRLLSGFNNQKGVIGSSSNEAATASGLTLKNSILDFIDSMKSGQSAIDNRAIANELARQRGTAGVYNTVNNGIRSGGTRLANMNASDSSAAGEIARAYGLIGRQQLSDIGNQYETENVGIRGAQSDLDMQRAAGVRRFDSSKESTIATILADAGDKLAALDTDMANASMTERIAIDQEKQNIRKSIAQILDNYSVDLGQVNNVKAMSQANRMAEANRRYSLGLAPESQFSYTSDAPSNISASGPVSSELPIFTYKKSEA